MRTRKRITLSEWAKGKPLGLVIMAQQLTIGAEALYKWLKLMKVEELVGDDISVPALREWLSLYRRHRHLEEVLIGIFRSLGGIAEYGANLAESIFEELRYIRKIGWENFKREWEQMTPDERSEKLREGERQLEELQRLHSDDIQSDIEGKIDEDLKQRLGEALKKPEMLFFLKVWAPCFIQYGELPGRLLKRARRGDIDAIEKILRVDPSVIGDPKICEHFYRSSWKRSKVDFNTVAKALQRGPKGKVTRRKTKYGIAGLISLASSVLGKRLTEPEIKGLFDAVAQELKNEEIDTSLAYAPEAFSKAIQRYRPKLQPDKK
jgi:hypothetical protein